MADNIYNDFMMFMQNASKDEHKVQLEDSMDKIKKAGLNSTPVKDSYRNVLTGTGDADKIEKFADYGFDNNTLNWPLWLALYNDSWVFRRAIDKPAQDEVNSGFILHGDSDYDNVYRLFNKYKTDLIDLLQWGALFGGSIAVMMFENITDEEMKLPLNKEKIKGARMKLYVTDRWYGVGVISSETVNNMRDVDFGKPKTYNVTFADGRSFEVDHSYVLRYEHRTAPKLVKVGQLQNWGYAEGAHILNELSRDDQLKSDITSLVNKSLIEVIKMAGMRGVFMGTDKGNEEQLRKRLEMVNWGRNFNSLTFLDKDDDYQMTGFTGLSGLSDLLEKNMWLVSAALDMQGVLYGELRNGLSQESTEAMERYATTIMNRCEAYYRPVLNKLLKVLFIICDIKDPVDFTFNSLVTRKLNNDKVDSIQKYVSLLNGLAEAGIISKYQVAKSLQDFMNKDIINIQFTDENMNKLKLEEEFQILEVIKASGKPLHTNKDILSSQFPEGQSPVTEPTAEDLPDKLDYVQEEVNNASAEQAPAEQQETPSIEE